MVNIFNKTAGLKTFIFPKKDSHKDACQELRIFLEQLFSILNTYKQQLLNINFSVPTATSFWFLNPIHATDLFLYPLKIWENLWFSDVFRRCKKRPVAWNEPWMAYFMTYLVSKYWFKVNNKGTRRALPHRIDSSSTTPIQEKNTLIFAFHRNVF